MLLQATGRNDSKGLVLPQRAYLVAYLLCITRLKSFEEPVMSCFIQSETNNLKYIKGTSDDGSVCQEEDNMMAEPCKASGFPSPLRFDFITYMRKMS